MTVTNEAYTQFWRTLTDELEQGESVIKALGACRAEHLEEDLDPVIQHIINEIQEGKTLSQALMEHPNVFPQSTVVTVKVGEAAGALDAALRRLVDGLENETLPGPSTDLSKRGEPAAWWRQFALLLEAGVPVMQVLDVLTSEFGKRRLRNATAAVRQGILEGRSMAVALESAPEVFEPSVRDAVRAAEEAGRLVEALTDIAEAVSLNNMGCLHRWLEPEVKVGEETVRFDEEGAPVVQFLNAVIRQAVKDRASDIHLEPREDGLHVRYRVDGLLYEMAAPPPHLAEAIINRAKTMAALDVAEKRQPQDGRICLKLEGRALDIRVSAVPITHGERIVMRLLSRENVQLDLSRIFDGEKSLATVRSLCKLPNGILISNGPTGSGKTTLLYAMLHEVDRERCSVMSVEDPVEFHLEGVSQIQVRPQLGLTFARALRAVLRQDPDVIMVSEIRDAETLNVCVQVALTGHLVMTSLHASTSGGAVRRLMDIGLEAFLINQSLAGVITQRLVRRLCDECKQPVEPALHSVPPEARQFVEEHPDATFFEPKGCEKCLQMGYRGRLAIHEILIPDERLKEVIFQRGDIQAIRDAAVAGGMKPMIIDGLEKAARGVTSVREVCRVAPRGPNE